MKKINTILSDEIPGVIVTIHMSNLIQHFGRERVLNCFYKNNKDAIISRHFNNLIETYGIEVFIDVLGIIQMRKAV